LAHTYFDKLGIKWRQKHHSRTGCW